jgi:hypothetical protein
MRFVRALVMLAMLAYAALASAQTTLSVNGGDAVFDAFVKSPALAGEYGVIIWFNGFQSRYEWYERLLNKVVADGYITMSYAVPGLMDVSTELVTRVDPLLSFIASGGLDAGLPAGVRANTTALFTAGHSRGGKVASLAYTSNQDVLNAVLVDPVDSSVFSPISERNPSAVQALKESGKTISVVGAGVEGSCNPAEGNYAKFFDAGAAGSWELVIEGAGHAQFLDAGRVLNGVQDALCGSGPEDRNDVADLVADDMVAWFSGNQAKMSAFVDAVDQDADVAFRVSR